ncbi:hypothetical protein A6R68_17808 [Neotoma lepida]|uniref:Peptidase S1 domain-containing protein n=1 Tax=Neotoma lepida TaxID=56216 RepID=A0A1A6HBS4_NEOLE|nr:hypothetical protein A6R68_17808 [Neotoma lepida]
MGTRAVRIPYGPSPLLWPLLLLLPLSPKAGPVLKPGVPSLSKVPGVAPGRREPQQGWEPSALRHQDSVSGAEGIVSNRLRGGVSTGCGKPKMVGKVFGGQDTLAGQWPWQASLLYRGLHLCGAVLIDSHWLVSTAHCFRNKSQAPGDYQVLLGNTQLYQKTQHTQKMSVNRIIKHPDFEKFHAFGSDIAMLQLRLPVNFTSYVVPACLPPKDTQLLNNTSFFPNYATVSITDFLFIFTAKLLPPFPLQEGEVGIIENELCNALYGRRPSQSRDYVHEEMLCAGGLSTGKSICQGDSGGPLICYQTSAWVLVGLASWGLDCRHPVYPSIFTRVAYFTNWIGEVKGLTPLPESGSVSPHTELQPRPLRAAGSPQPCSILIAAQIWFLLLFIPEGQDQAPG